VLALVCFLQLSARLVSDLPLLLLLGLLETESGVSLKLTAFAHGDLVEFKFETVLVALVYDVSKEVNDAALVVRVKLLDRHSELVLLIVIHRPLAYLLF
jgi:hypothetical protein